MDALTILKQYFGHSRFRAGQEKIVEALLNGRDALCVMPTGAGKSVCYQVPALMLPGVTLVISPLISLMKDQVTALRQMEISAAYINSSLTAAQCREMLRRASLGMYKIIYAAPERLETPDFLRFAQGADIGLIAVDEAHCVSQWGQDFRPSYLKIAGFIDALPKRPAVGAFTATATERVREDIIRLLRLNDPCAVTTGFDRPNLYFDVQRPKKKKEWLANYVREKGDACGIVYCATRKNVEDVCAFLQRQGVSAARYHAGLSDEERRQSQEDFVYDRVRVMVATNAFGMGIDKSSVSFVVHYNMPKDMESYYQEAGRAGRDGSAAECILLYSAGDVQTARFLIEKESENEELTDAEKDRVRGQELARLERMTGYCKTTGCLRGTLLKYFGEDAPSRCGSCGNCVSEAVEQDITLEAQKILSGVARAERRYATSVGVTQIVRMLTGSQDKRVLQLDLHTLPTYGIMRDVNRQQLRDWINVLIEQEYLILTRGEYPVLRLTPKAGDVLYRGERVIHTVRRALAAKPGAAVSAADDTDLFSALKRLRFRLAQREHVPAYVIFSNATLLDMARKRPHSLEDFLRVSGVGDFKAARYAASFLEEIRDWEAKH